MDVNFKYTDYTIDGKECFLVKLPVEFYIKEPNFGIIDFIPAPKVVNAIKLELNKKLGRIKPSPIVCFLRCNNECLEFFSKLSDNHRYNNGEYIVKSEDCQLEELIRERLEINIGDFYKKDKPWLSDYVSVDALM